MKFPKIKNCWENNTQNKTISREVQKNEQFTLCLQTFGGASAFTNELCDKGCEATKTGRWFY